MLTKLTKSKCFIAGLAVIFVFAFVFTTCEDLGYTAESSDPDPETPEITEQPQSGTFTIGESAELSVTAKVTDGGVLSYQWYIAEDFEQYNDDEGEPIKRATSKTYAIDEEGVHQIYVVVTNSLSGKTASVKSDLARVLINDPDNAFWPEITAEPASTAYPWPDPGQIDAIKVTARVGDNGTLSYKWFKSATYSSSGGQEISGATTDSYLPQITDKGTSYYYVEVTNTNNGKPGRKVSSIYSSPAVIKAVSANATITVSDTKAQYVRGFGVMANFWSNSPDVSLKDYEKMFNPRILGYNMLRVMVPVSDSTSMKETMKRALNNELSGARDRSNYFEMVKLANKYNGFVLASPWSPPPSWKTNNDIRGGGAGEKAILKREFWQDYADYLKEYCQIMYDNKAPIYAVSIQNEPNFNASYDGCEWTDPEMRDFFMTVGRFTEGVKGWGGGEEIPTVLTMSGESANDPSINNPALAEQKAYQHIDLFARHIYGNATVSIADRVQNLPVRPDGLRREVWMTEYNVNGGNDTVYPLDSTYNYMWRFINTIDLVIRLNKENAFIWWYGKRFYSMMGDGDYGTVDGVILPRGWALSHYAKYASDTYQVGLTVSGTDASGAAVTAGTSDGFNHTSSGYDLGRISARATAFVSKDGNSYSLVLFTPTNNDGSGGRDLGDIRIVFPSGFKATKVTAMRTKAGDMGKDDTDTVLLKGGTGAFVNLPRGQILSVKFTK